MQKRNDEFLKDDEILNLKYDGEVENIGLLIDYFQSKEKSIIYKFERLSFLWNHPNYQNYIKRMFIEHIEFIREIIKSENHNYNYTKLHEKYPLLGEIGNVSELIKSLDL